MWSDMRGKIKRTYVMKMRGNVNIEYIRNENEGKWGKQLKYEMRGQRENEKKNE